MDERVLIIGLSFNDAYGGGITLRNLFSGFRPNQVGVIDYCVTQKDLKYSTSLFNISIDNEIVEDIKATSKVNNTGWKWVENIKVDFIRLVLLSLRKYFAYYFNNFVRKEITPNLKKFITDFKPDFFYLVPYNRNIIDLVLRLNRMYSIPIVTHFMDDFRGRSPLDICYYLNEYLTRQRIKKIVNK